MAEVKTLNELKKLNEAEEGTLQQLTKLKELEEQHNIISQEI